MRISTEPFFRKVYKYHILIWTEMYSGCIENLNNFKRRLVKDTFKFPCNYRFNCWTTEYYVSHVMLKVKGYVIYKSNKEEGMRPDPKKIEKAFKNVTKGLKKMCKEQYRTSRTHFEAVLKDDSLFVMDYEELERNDDSLYNSVFEMKIVGPQMVNKKLYKILNKIEKSFL